MQRNVNGRTVVFRWLRTVRVDLAALLPGSSLRRRHIEFLHLWDSFSSFSLSCSIQPVDLSSRPKTHWRSWWWNCKSLDHVVSRWSNNGETLFLHHWSIPTIEKEWRIGFNRYPLTLAFSSSDSSSESSSRSLPYRAMTKDQKYRSLKKLPFTYVSVSLLSLSSFRIYSRKTCLLLASPALHRYHCQTSWLIRDKLLVKQFKQPNIEQSVQYSHEGIGWNCTIFFHSLVSTMMSLMACRESS